MTAITIIEANRLTEQECQMEQDQAAFVRYGNALLESIRLTNYTVDGLVSRHRVLIS